MYNALMVLVVGLFLVLLFLNIYFRAKVIKVYRRLVHGRVDFNTSHLLNLDKMEQEVIPKYPNHAEDIRTFVGHIRFSIGIAILLVLLITALSAILYYFQ